MRVVDNYISILSQSGPLDLLYVAVLHLGPLFALIVGRRLERAIAGVYLLVMVIGWSTADLSRPAGMDAEAAFSILYLMVIGAIAVRRGAPGWTLFAAAFLLALVATWLIAIAANVPRDSFALLSLVRGWEYLFVFALAVGAWSSRRSAARTDGPDERRRAALDGAPG